MDDLLKVIDEARFGGQTIIKYVGNSDSTVYGPGISLQVLANAYLNDTKEKVVVSTWCDGQYGVQDFAFGVPVIMGKNGVEKILDLKISKQDQQNYDTSYRFSLELDRQKEKS
jgi:malate dehydrogenase